MENEVLGENVKKIKNIFLVYKKDILALLIIVMCFLVSFLYIGKIYGDLFMDCGREAYLPQLILQGKVLYKDIFSMYNPLSYQINAVLYFIFGSKLNVLYFASCVNAILFLFGLYFISRMFINEFYSCVINLLLMSFYIFGSVKLISYIMPYAFSFPYAVTFFTYSILTFLVYMKTENQKFVYLAMLLMGLSFACRVEFLLCLIPVFIVLMYKKEKITLYLYSFLILVLPTIFSYGILFFQGFTHIDLLNYINFIKTFFETDEQKYYTYSSVALSLNINILKHVISIFLDFITYCLVGFFVFLLIFCKRKIKYIGLLLLPFFVFYTYNYLEENSGNHIFCWAIFMLIAFIYFNRNKFSDNKDKMLLFLVFVGIFSMARINFLPLFKDGHSIYFLIPLLSFWIIFINTNIKFINKYNCKKYLSYVLIILTFVHIYSIRENLVNYQIIKTTRGTIKTQSYSAEMFKNIVNWVENNTEQKDTVLLLPEGVMVNYVTGRPTLNKLYHLVPNHISALGEENIIRELYDERPKYIVINYLYYGMYGEPFICSDFGESICEFVQKNYFLEQKFTTRDNVKNKFVAEIYKQK